MYKYFTIYNTCGISGKDNIEMYIESITSLLNQSFKDHRVILSACLNRDEQIKELQKEFGSTISYSIINEKLPVNITFNKTCQLATKEFGKPKGYMYVDSGCNPTDKDIIQFMDEHFTDRFGMVACVTDTDNGLQDWLGFMPKENFIMPIGFATNLHFQIFHTDIYNRYGRLMPDIFRSTCTESVFSFLNASIDKEWLVLMDKVVEHIKAVDGPSSGFTEHMGWCDTFYNQQDWINILRSQECNDCGFGFEECNRICMHNPMCYENGKCKDPERLAKFIEQAIFLDMNYEDIKYEWA